MNEHAGPACALSGLIVAIFAVLLHENTPPRPVPVSPVQVGSNTLPAGGGASKADAPSAIRQTPSGAIAAVSPRVEKPSIAIRTGRPREVPATVPESSRLPATGVQPPPGPAKDRRKPSPAIPRPTFAVVEEGESLAEVAVRLYGSNDATEALWKANRDQVERIDSPLARGTLLRVP